MTRLSKIQTFFMIFSAVAVFQAAPASADTLGIPVPPTLQDTPTTGHSVTLPGRGMTMITVEERFGSPREKYDEVGDPPISRWVYSDFTVYFEYQYVINAVAHDAMARPAAQ